MTSSQVRNREPQHHSRYASTKTTPMVRTTMRARVSVSIMKPVAWPGCRSFIWWIASLRIPPLLLPLPLLLSLACRGWGLVYGWWWWWLLASKKLLGEPDLLALWERSDMLMLWGRSDMLMMLVLGLKLFVRRILLLLLVWRLNRREKNDDGLRLVMAVGGSGGKYSRAMDDEESSHAGSPR
ncbi:hypothetical protein F4778DRAFT_724533 [Xylariomycetidae sp. FL2044]|nr:hypothetical protein F4778DRAFT_724533 [Xylariomycetidae sp. FL2044]